LLATSSQYDADSTVRDPQIALPAGIARVQFGQPPANGERLLERRLRCL